MDMFDFQEEAKEMLHKILKEQEIRKKNRKNETRREMRQLTKYINNIVK